MGVTAGHARARNPRRIRDARKLQAALLHHRHLALCKLRALHRRCRLLRHGSRGGGSHAAARRRRPLPLRESGTRNTDPFSLLAPQHAHKTMRFLFS